MSDSMETHSIDWEMDNYAKKMERELEAKLMAHEKKMAEMKWSLANRAMDCADRVLTSAALSPTPAGISIRGLREAQKTEVLWEKAHGKHRLRLLKTSWGSYQVNLERLDGALLEGHNYEGKANAVLQFEALAEKHEALITAPQIPRSAYWPEASIEGIKSDCDCGAAKIASNSHSHWCIELQSPEDYQGDECPYGECGRISCDKIHIDDSDED
ncbi:MAG: hypothetical protein E6R04_07235 [Spirochaetes bacterium]|nr:MAG: hypothetical protein E6R04_07235 [Spirochaetota bacterium]